MKLRLLRLFGFALITGTLVLTACAAVTGKPTVVISSPPSGSQYKEGNDVTIQSTSTDQTGVTRVELTVDGAVVRNDTPPIPQTSYPLVQTWKAAPGNHTLMVRAYNAAGAASDPAAILLTVTAVASSGPTTTATSAASVPSSTGTPTTAAAACTNNSAFVTDVTVPTNATLAPKQAFNKTWRFNNNGTCVWAADLQFVFVGGEAMTLNAAIPVPTTQPGATADFSVAMTAPESTGVHSGQWQLRGSDGIDFGDVANVKINVVGAPPPAPPSAKCSGTPNISSFSASPTSFIGGGSTKLSWGAVTNAESAEIDNGIGGVPTPGNATVPVAATTTYTLVAHCGSNIATKQVTVTVTKLIKIPPIILTLFQVTSVSASGQVTGQLIFCPRGYSFDATITTNLGGDVKYQWVRTSGNGPSGTLHFDAAGTKSVPAYAYNASTADKSGSVHLHVSSPNSIDSNSVSYSCVQLNLIQP